MKSPPEERDCPCSISLLYPHIRRAKQMTQQPQKMSLRDQYVKRILDSEAEFGGSNEDAETSLGKHRQRIIGIVNDLVADVSIEIGKGQREGVRVTALALGYKVEDRGSIADMTKELVKQVKRKPS